MLLVRTAILAALCALPALGQTTAQLGKELKAKEAAAKKDPDALFEVGKWAAEKSLGNDAKRIYQAVLKLKPDHAGAHEALGDELVEGKWLPAKEAAAARKKAAAIEYAAKGFVEVDGIWVEKEKVADAKRGVFHHEGQQVTKAEMAAFMAGKVRHPDTGEIIDGKHLEKAKTKYFPVAGDRWVDEKEADTYHSDPKRPWIVRSTNCTVISTLPLAKIQELKIEADKGYERVAPLLGNRVLAPAKRPVVLIAATVSEYRDLGNSVGDGTDAWGAFLIEDKAAMAVPYLGEVRLTVCDNNKDFVKYNVRHAAAIAYAHNCAASAGVTMPLWMLHGFGALTSRFENESDAGWFGTAHQQRGGARNIKGFFSGFAISGDMEPTVISYNVYQAGLLLQYADKGGDAEATAALKAVSDCLAGEDQGKTFDKALAKLQTVLIDAESKIGAYLQVLMTKAPK